MDLRFGQNEPESTRILVVEDDAILGRMVERSLAGLAGDVVLARTGAEAFALLEGGGFMAVATDISLPDISGFQVIAGVRQRAPEAGIVAITGFVDIDTAVEAMKAGADDFLGKPFDPRILWHMLKKARESRRRSLESEQSEVYRRLAYTDALTGSPNRRYLDEFLDDALQSCRQAGEPLGIAFMDVDNFKLLNDVVGHEQGDTVLRSMADLLDSLVRPPAAFGRFGGDEFVAIFPGMPRERVMRFVEDVRAGVRRLDVRSGSHIVVPMRVSCGVAVATGAKSRRDLMAEAEDQMYIDKSAPYSVLTRESDEPRMPPGVLKIANVKALRSLVKAIDRRDRYTRLHSDHATSIALKVAHAIGMEEAGLNGIAIGGPIHDLGKIVIPDEILRKPGPLTIEERMLMEEHPIVGAAITAAVTDYETVIDLVRHHHEWFNGNGYPGGLRGTGITLATRVFGIADAFSAMTTDRPYRRALDIDHAVAEVVSGMGTQFDPELVSVFEQVIFSEAEASDAA